jgi:hypothetical protein
VVRGYETPTPFLNQGQLPILELSCFTRPKPTGTGFAELFVCNPYWMQHLVRPHVSGQLRNGNKVGSPMSTTAWLTNAGYGALPEGTYYSVVTLGGRVT